MLFSSKKHAFYEQRWALGREVFVKTKNKKQYNKTSLASILNSIYEIIVHTKVYLQQNALAVN